MTEKGSYLRKIRHFRPINHCSEHKKNNDQLERNTSILSEQNVRLGKIDASFETVKLIIMVVLPLTVVVLTIIAAVVGYYLKTVNDSLITFNKDIGQAISANKVLQADLANLKSDVDELKRRDP